MLLSWINAAPEAKKTKWEDQASSVKRCLEFLNNQTGPNEDGLTEQSPTFFSCDPWILPGGFGGLFGVPSPSVFSFWLCFVRSFFVACGISLFVLSVCSIAGGSLYLLLVFF